MSLNKNSLSKLTQVSIGVLVILVISLGLAWLSPDFCFLPFFSVTLLAVFLYAVGWLALRSEAIPGWVGILTVFSATLRLAMGLTWFILLPLYGHGSEVEQAGYIMSDAYHRDTAAWELAKSDQPLIAAFQEYRQEDQYGGLLYLSALVYRAFGGDVHQPLMMVILTSVFSSGMIPFSWILTKRLWGSSVAKATVWIIALYPEAVLLGSSQMREAFMMTLMSMGIFGLVKYWQDRNWRSFGWLFLALALSIPLSTMFSVMLLIVLFLMAIFLFRVNILRNWKLWAIFGGLLVVGIGAVWMVGERIYPDGASDPITLIRQWFVFAGRWEKRAIALSSGWFNKILNRSPEWMHIWLILGYGSFQPFLPAALIATGNWLWRIIALWRSIGWTLMLIFLVYAPFRALKQDKEKLLPTGMTIIAWGGILLAAFRGGGDQWDNPRYRVVFLIVQASLMGWIWIKHRESNDPGLRRVIIGLGLIFAWFIPWYLRRYSSSFTWPIVDLFKTIALGFISAILYWLYDWARVSGSIERNETSK